MSDVLHNIIADKKKEVDYHKSVVSIKALENELKKYDKDIKSLVDALQKSESGIIAEFKRRSPSKGWINESASAKEIVPIYENSGATAISILTDEKYFGGLLDDLKIGSSLVNVPVLRKDFIIDEYQIIQARLFGASAILLIAAALTKDEVNRLTRFAIDLGLDILLELHDESELDYIRPEHNIIGINNRNLGTFDTTIDKSYQMSKHLPSDAIWVAESGISSPETVTELRKVGYRGFLIGEHFMRGNSPGEELINFIEFIRKS